jgi:hypothetical protein
MIQKLFLGVGGSAPWGLESTRWIVCVPPTPCLTVVQKPAEKQTAVRCRRGESKA